ncbi:MAG: CHAP domain-containing protein [Bacteroidia bacterium]
MVRKIQIFLLLSIGAITIVLWPLVVNSPGDKIDEWNNIAVYHNGLMSNVQGRNVSSDGYNIGLKWQCVEFVKRYYYQYLNHKMPNSYGNAKDYFNRQLGDGKFNSDRGLFQYRNGGISCPKPNDIIIFEASSWNKFGHVAIVIEVRNTEVEIIQQNDFINGARRMLKLDGNTCTIENPRVLGWLRKEK